MRIVCISDTHNRLDEVNVPDGDVLIHAGDATMGGKLKELTKFNFDLGKLSHKYKFICAGNHDWLFEKEPSFARSLITNGTYLQDQEIIVDGVKFYLSPHQPVFYNWAFNLKRGAQLRQKWMLIPQDTDVLVTHGPPLGFGDTVTRDMGINWESGEGNDFGYRTEHVGCADLAEIIEKVKPKIHVFGHIHVAYGVYYGEHTMYVNASICDEKYYPSNKPIVIDFDEKNRTVKTVE